MNILLLCSAVLVLLYAGLSVNVSLTRLRKRKYPSVTEAEVTKAIRAHGNASEYVPLFIALFVFLSFSAPSVVVKSVAVLATASRILHAAGMLRMASISERHPFKFYGALGTYISLFALGVDLLIRAL